MTTEHTSTPAASANGETPQPIHDEALVERVALAILKCRNREYKDEWFYKAAALDRELGITSGTAFSDTMNEARAAIAVISTETPDILPGDAVIHIEAEDQRAHPHAATLFERHLTCVNCGHPLDDNQRMKYAMITNTTASWAKDNLRILAEMAEDRAFPKWFSDEVMRIRDGIKLVPLAPTMVSASAETQRPSTADAPPACDALVEQIALALRADEACEASPLEFFYPNALAAIRGISAAGYRIVKVSRSESKPFVFDDLPGCDNCETENWTRDCDSCTAGERNQ